MVYSHLTRVQGRWNKSGQRSVKLSSVGRCSLETKLNNRIMSLNTDIAKKQQKLLISLPHWKLLYKTMVGSFSLQQCIKFLRKGEGGNSDLLLTPLELCCDLK